MIELMIKDYWRFAGSLLYLLAGVVILFLMADGWNILTQLDWPRYSWCVSWAMFGMAGIAFEQSAIDADRRGEDGIKKWSVIHSYFTRYLIGILLVSALVYVIFSAYDKTTGPLFYFATAPICFTVGYLIDFFVQKPFSFVRSWLHSLIQGRK